MPSTVEHRRVNCYGSSLRCVYQAAVGIEHLLGGVPDRVEQLTNDQRNCKYGQCNLCADWASYTCINLYNIPIVVVLRRIRLLSRC